MLTLDKLLLKGPIATSRLSPSVAMLLEAFIKAPKSRLGFSDIADLLALEQDEAFKASLQVRVVRLRKKLHAVGANESSIESVRNIGYQLFETIKLQ